MSKKHMGSRVDDFLKEEGIFAEAQAQAVRRWGVFLRDLAGLRVRVDREPEESVVVRLARTHGIWNWPSGKRYHSQPWMLNLQRQHARRDLTYYDCGPIAKWIEGWTEGANFLNCMGVPALFQQVFKALGSYFFL